MRTYWLNAVLVFLTWAATPFRVDGQDSIELTSVEPCAATARELALTEVALPPGISGRTLVSAFGYGADMVPQMSILELEPTSGN